jgi:hypothetical protein
VLELKQRGRSTRCFEANESVAGAIGINTATFAPAPENPAISIFPRKSEKLSFIPGSPGDQGL